MSKRLGIELFADASNPSRRFLMVFPAAGSTQWKTKNLPSTKLSNQIQICIARLRCDLCHCCITLLTECQTPWRNGASHSQQHPQYATD